MIVLHYAPDNASLMVRLALEELGLPYETRLVDRRTRAQDSAAFRRLNPHGLIPACEIGDRALFETAAILLTLSEQTGRLFPPPGAPERGEALSWLFFVSNTLHAELRQLFYGESYVGRDPVALAAHRTVVEARARASFGRLDAAYSGRADAPWFVGAGPSILDLYAAVCLRWAQLYPTAAPIWPDAPRGLPALAAMAAALEARPAIRRGCAAEGIAPPAFSAATHVAPPEGSAL